MKKLINSAVIAGLSLAPTLALAQTNGGLSNLEGGNLNLGTNLDLIQTIGQIINFLLGFLGVIALVLILYAGFLWMTAAGNEENIAKAKKIIGAAVIGLVIILAAFAIANFIISNLSQSLNANI